MSVLVPPWGRSSPAARPAFLAAYYEAVIGLIVFVVLVVIAMNALDQSLGATIFGPTKGAMPLIVWVLFMAIVVSLQTAIALALRRDSAWTRAIGALGAGGLALIAILWIAALLIWSVTSLGGYLEQGGDRWDLLGVLVFTPIIVWLGWLNGRAAMRVVVAQRGG